VASIEREWARLLGKDRMVELKESLSEIAGHIGVRYAGSVSEATTRRTSPTRSRMR
jgi:hypothetical protein